jgi:hypothetical protein
MPRSPKVLVLVAAIGAVLSRGCASRESARGTGGAQGSGGTSTGSGGVVHSGGASPTAGAPGTGGATSNGGTPGTGGAFIETGGRGVGGASTGTGGSGSGGVPAGVGGAFIDTGGRGTGGASTGVGGALGKFSFFVTGLESMRRLSGSADGFGGDLRFGEADGLAGADKICATIADTSMPGSSVKGWRAFLSVVGPPTVNAIDRIGQGPWYDRMGRLLAAKKADLLQIRPRGGDPAIVEDLPNEYGIQNHNPDGLGNVDNHDVMTGTSSDGKLLPTALQRPTLTCYDWTNSEKVGAADDLHMEGSGPFCGHSWAGSWMAYLTEGGCGAGINLVESGPPMPGVYTVGTGGGYGAIYCFALKP